MSDESCSWWDPFGPAFLADPYPVYHRLRAQGPVLWHDRMQSWIVTGHELCDGILSDWKAFASDFRRVGDDEPPPSISVQTLDPPEQRPVHQLLAQAVRAQDTARLTATARMAAEKRLKTLAAEGGDFITDLALPVSVDAALRLLGAPQDDRQRLAELSSAVVASMNAGLRPDTAQAGHLARQELSAAIARWTRDSPAEGVMAFVAAHRDDSIPASVMDNSLRVLLLAGINSAQRMLGLALLTLLRDDAARNYLTAMRETVQPDTAMTAMAHELVRFDNPFQAQSRKCTRQVELAGRRLSRGATVVLMLGAANRDPERFTEPDQFMPRRHPNPHLGFGRGVHACLGAPIAMRLLRGLLEAMIACGDRVALAKTPTFDQNPTLRGLVNLPICQGRLPR